MLRVIENEMFVRVAGDEGELGTLVYVHGLGESGLCFEEVAGHPGLAGFRQLIPDLPGYGRSRWLAEPRSMVGHADDLAAWLRDRGEAPVIVVGHSMGAVVALLLAERHRDVVAQVIDVDGNVAASDCSFSGEASAVAVERFRESVFAAMLERIYRDGVEDRALRGYYVSLRLCDPRAYHLNSAELVAASRREDIAERLAQLDRPVVYIAGAPHGASPRSRALLDQAGVATVEISPAGHWPFIDRPNAFVRAVAAALTSR